MQKLEISFFGIRRSGNHGILSWIINNYPGSLMFINNINGHDQAPFPYSPIMLDRKRCFQDRITLKDIPYFKVKKNFSCLHFFCSFSLLGSINEQLWEMLYLVSCQQQWNVCCSKVLRVCVQSKDHSLNSLICEHNLHLQ